MLFMNKTVEILLFFAMYALYVYVYVQSPVCPSVIYVPDFRESVGHTRYNNLVHPVL
jgi:hypothetical protein